MSGFTWPMALHHGDVKLRPLRWSDRQVWAEVRRRNEKWLGPWEATNPDGTPRMPRFADLLGAARREAREGRSLPFAIEHDGLFVGQITLGNIVWGSLRAGYIGYWIDEMVAGRGITPTAVSMVTDFAIQTAGLHRIEINIRPENQSSIRVVQKLGFRFEGERLAYLHIDGQWRDHHVYVMTAESFPPGGLVHLRPLHH